MSALAVSLFCAIGAPAAPPDGPVDGYHDADDVGAKALGSWTHLGGNAARSGKGKAGSGGATLPPPLWTTGTDHLGRDIVFLTPTGVVAEEYGAFAVGTIEGFDHLIWFDPGTGDVRATVQVPDALLDSIATPAIDTRNFDVLVASGDTLTAVSLIFNSVKWQTQLDNITVNASPLVTTDRGPADRAFITDYSFLGGAAGKLYCINVDAYNELENPYLPGEIVWDVSLGGGTSGNSPSYANNTVFVSTATGPSGAPAGRVLAFDAGATVTPEPLWTFTNTQSTGFFGGTTIVGTHVYASSYAFNGDDRSANTVKIDANDGSLVWSCPSNRTNATPIVAGSLVIVSGGLPDDPALPSFGTFPTVQVISRLNGTILWDTARDTWVDTNTNGELDQGEYISLGGWTHQPLVLVTDTGPKLIVGSVPSSSPLIFDPYDVLWMIDLKWEPGSPTPLLLGAQLGAGSTPAFANGRIFSIGPAGLSAFER